MTSERKESSRDFVPLGVRHGGLRVRLGWWVKGPREAVALRFAPWLNVPAAPASESEIDRLANDLAGDWKERAERAEREVTVWKERLVRETERLRGLLAEAPDA